jgi:hypothetical protein
VGKWASRPFGVYRSIGAFRKALGENSRLLFPEVLLILSFRDGDVFQWQTNTDCRDLDRAQLAWFVGWNIEDKAPLFSVTVELNSLISAFS